MKRCVCVCVCVCVNWLSDCYAFIYSMQKLIKTLIFPNVLAIKLI